MFLKAVASFLQQNKGATKLASLAWLCESEALQTATHNMLMGKLIVCKAKDKNFLPISRRARVYLDLQETRRHPLC